MRRSATRRRLSGLLAGALALAGAVFAPAAQAEQTPTADQCVAAGSPLQNGGFESPALGTTGTTGIPPGGLGPWQTTDSEFEVWSGGANGVPPAQGDQLIELNSTMPGTVYQAVATAPGAVIQWSFAHRARNYGDPPGLVEETMELLIGPSLAAAVSIGQYTDSDLGWAYHLGQYQVPAGQTSTVFAFRAVSSFDPTTGNFLDNVQLLTSPCLVAETSIADTGGGAVQRGDVLTVSTTVRNDGYVATASKTQVSTPIPPQTTLVPGSLTVDGASVTDAAADDTGEIAGPDVHWRVGAGADGVDGGELAPGSSASVSFQVVVNADATGSVSATSTARGVWSSFKPLGVSTSNTATLPLAIADLATTIPGPAASVAGSVLALDAVTANAGPDDALDVVVTSNLPAALVPVTATPDPALAGGSCIVVGAQATCTYPVLPAGATATTQIAAALSPSLPPGATFAATAASAARTEDPAPANNTALATAGPSTTAADLAVSLRYGSATFGAATPVGAAPLAPGDAIRLTARVVSNGPSDSQGATVSLMLAPVGRNWVVAPSEPASCLTFGSRALCRLGPMAPGHAVTFEISGVLGSVAPAGSLTLASSASVTGASAPDPSSANDIATATLPVQIVATADLGTTIVLTTPIVSGGPVSYLVSTVNTGPSDAVGVTVTTLVPAGVADPVGVPDLGIPGGSCATVDRTITCTYPLVRLGTIVRTTVTGTAEAGQTLATALTASAASRSGTPDANGVNNVAATTALPAALTTARRLATTGPAAMSTAWLGVSALLLGAVLLIGGARRRCHTDNAPDLHSVHGRY